MEILKDGSTIRDCLEGVKTFLASGGLPEPPNEARLLLSTVLGVKPSELFIRGGETVDARSAELIEAALKRRLTREPIQYILGIEEFYSLDFVVTPAVLIPRPETELLVDEAVKGLKGLDNPELVDIGTGSGAIIVAVSTETDRARCVATDISSDALDVARLNAERNGVTDRIEFLHGDLFAPLQKSESERAFDMIVSNPPYVASADIMGLEPEVSEFEPHLALSGGLDGLDIYRRIVKEASSYLKPKGMLLLEVGFDQAASVVAMIEESDGLEVDGVAKDLSGIDRVVKARLR